MEKELSDSVYEKIESLSEEGNELYETEQFHKAQRKYEQALALVPEPKTDWEASTWLYTSLGDTFFAKAQLEEAKDSYYNALNCPDGLGNAYIQFSLGQVLFELGELKKSKEYLLRAYMLDGEEIFEDEDPKYLNHIKDQGLPQQINEKEIASSIVQAKGYDEKGEKEKVFKQLQDTFNTIPEPKNNYEAAERLLVLIVAYHNKYGNHEEAVRLIEKLDDYSYAGNENLFFLHKAKAYYQAGQKIKAREFFWEFINKYSLEVFKKNHSEYMDMYIDSL